MIVRRVSFAKAGSPISLTVGLVLAWMASQVAPARAEPTASAPGAVVYFHSPLDGARVPQRFSVKIGLKEMGVAPAGVTKEFTGHHHLLVDTDMVPLDQPIPSDYNHIHLGNGQTETADAASGNSYIAIIARGPRAHPSSTSRRVEEDHDLCALSPEDGRIRFAGPLRCRDAEAASGWRCLDDVAVGDIRLWPECAE
jgi:hypothetical protein